MVHIGLTVLIAPLGQSPGSNVRSVYLIDDPWGGDEGRLEGHLQVNSLVVTASILSIPIAATLEVRVPIAWLDLLRNLACLLASGLSPLQNTL